MAFSSILPRSPLRECIDRALTSHRDRCVPMHREKGEIRLRKRAPKSEESKDVGRRRRNVLTKLARSRPPIEPFSTIRSKLSGKTKPQQNRLSARTPQRTARVVVVKAADKASVSV